MNTALIVIDIQEDYIGKSPKRRSLYEADNLINSINERIDFFNKDGKVVIYVKNSRKQLVSDIVKGLDIVSSNIFIKERASCFSNAELLTLLKKLKISTIEIAGIDGNSCIKFSLMDGVKLGFNMIFNTKTIGVANPDLFFKTKQMLIDKNVKFL